jgi:hypothetical protein
MRASEARQNYYDQFAARYVARLVFLREKVLHVGNVEIVVLTECDRAMRARLVMFMPMPLSCLFAV